MIFKKFSQIQKKSKTVRYIIVGVNVYLIEIAIILVAQKLGTSAILAVGLSFWFGLFISFLLQKLFTFQDRRMRTRVIVPQIAAVVLLVLFNFIFTIAVTHLLQNILSVIIIRTIALSFTTLWNFYIYKTKIFRSHDIVPID